MADLHDDVPGLKDLPGFEHWCGAGRGVHPNADCGCPCSGCLEVRGLAIRNTHSASSENAIHVTVTTMTDEDHERMHYAASPETRRDLMANVLVEDRVAMRVEEVERGWWVSDRRGSHHSTYPTALVTRGAKDGDFVCEQDGLFRGESSWTPCVHVRAVLKDGRA